MFGEHHYQDVTWTFKGDLLWTRSTSMGLNDVTLEASDQHWNNSHHKWFYSIIYKGMYPSQHSKLGQKISRCSKVKSSNFAVALIRLLGIKARLRINQSRHQERRINRFFFTKNLFLSCSSGFDLFLRPLKVFGFGADGALEQEKLCRRKWTNI